ncbi:MAG: cysteine desulfurase family protein [Chlamydiales bacterium]
MTIYLDNNATTFLDPRVLASIEALLRQKVGNPSSIHSYGQIGRAILAKATKDVANFFSVQPSEIVFTSGATEALNMVIRSLPAKSHVITSSLEHIAVLEALKMIHCEIDYLNPCPGYGSITSLQVQEAMRSNTSAIILTAANNETGIITDIELIADLSQRYGVALIIDGVARLGKGNWVLPKGVSAACFSGHKIHGPSGVGVAVIRKSYTCHPIIVGGPQQYRMRGGTENLAGILGFAEALKFLPTSGKKMRDLRDYFENGLTQNLSGIFIHGINESRLCNTSNIAFEGVDGETLLMQLDLLGISASHGSACSSGALETSRVLLNMGIEPSLARSSIRFSISRFTTLSEIDKALSIVTKCIRNAKKF